MTCCDVMRWAHVILDLLRIFVSWPLAIAVIAVWFMVRFRDEIAHFIRERGFDIRAGGARTVSPPPQSGALAHAQPEALQFERPWRFERILNVIYGSQLTLLEDLYGRGDQGASAVELSPYYDRFAAAVSQGNVPVPPWDVYAGFLEQSGLVRREVADEAMPHYFITDLGTAFLQYLRHAYTVTPFRAF